MKQKSFFLTSKGFTLIELLVIIAITGLLSSIILASLKSAREKAKITRVQMDFNQLKKAMLMYKMDVGELPPRGDWWPNGCFPNCPNTWNLMINALLTNDGPGWAGPYLQSMITYDPWGHHYAGDDNDCNANCGNTDIISAGPDGTLWTSDDLRLRITTVQEVTGCCY